MKYAIVIVSALTVFFISISCQRNKEENGITTSTLITFSSGNASRTGLSGNILTSNPGSVINEGDVISGSGASVIIIQIADEAILLISGKASLRFDAVSGKQRTLALLSGSVVGKVKKLNKNDGFLIKTPSSVISVRGTDFIITSSGRGTAVSVTDGKIAAASSVERLQTYDAYIINSGQAGRITAESADSIRVTFSDISAETYDKIKAVHEIPMILDADRKSGDELEKSIAPFLHESLIHPASVYEK